MIARDAILTTIETLLEATTGLTAVPCVVDDGAKENDILSALRDPGAVITLPPIVKVTPRLQAAGSALMDAQFLVRLLVNPSVNAAQMVPLVFETARGLICAAVIGQAAEDNGDRYRLVGDELTDFDPGLLSATMTFEKGFHCNPAA